MLLHNDYCSDTMLCSPPSYVMFRWSRIRTLLSQLTVIWCWIIKKKKKKHKKTHKKNLVPLPFQHLTHPQVLQLRFKKMQYNSAGLVVDRQGERWIKLCHLNVHWPCFFTAGKLWPQLYSFEMFFCSYYNPCNKNHIIKPYVETSFWSAFDFYFELSVSLLTKLNNCKVT